jgi:hypothetical protein
LSQFYIFSSSSGLPEVLENLLQEKEERIRVSLTFFKHQSMKNICVHFKKYARTSFALTHCIMNGLHSCYLPVLRNLFYTHLQRIRPLSKVWNTVFRFTRQLHKHTPLIFIFICIVYNIYFLKEICLPFYDPWVYRLYIIYFNFRRHLRMFT